MYKYLLYGRKEDHASAQSSAGCGEKPFLHRRPMPIPLISCQDIAVLWLAAGRNVPGRQAVAQRTDPRRGGGETRKNEKINIFY